MELEFKRNRERYTLLKWAQNAFHNLKVIPPGSGIIHQVNLEYLASVVHLGERDGERLLYPDTLLGTDSHTTMINGLSVLGWGVGGIEAEAVMLGQPYYMLIPEVIGVKLMGELREGATATALVLTVTETLRKKGVVGKFVEYFGPGVSRLTLPDRATIANMSPEYGATVGFFPIDGETLNYLRLTGREDSLIERVEIYAKEQGLFRREETPDPLYTDVVEIDMSEIEPSVAGPRRPQDRIPLRELKKRFYITLRDNFGHIPKSESRWVDEGGSTAEGPHVGSALEKKEAELDLTRLRDGSVVIAAITSCTNTSNPSLMIGAGILAKKAVERGLKVSPHVKASLAPGSKVVEEYLRSAGLLPYLEALRFHLVGFGCTTCIGNSGPLPRQVSETIKKEDLVVVSVLSGNRNFEARIHPLVKANYLASPILVVAFALAGKIDIDFEKEPIQFDPNGEPVYLRDIWPTSEEIKEAMERALTRESFRKKYESVFEGDEKWRSLPVPEGDIYQWDPQSTYIKEPPFFLEITKEVPPLEDIEGARVLAVLGDTVTTDHISPAGAIPQDGPAGKYLIEKGVKPEEFNTFGSRRGNHEVMMRGTFANIRIRNRLVHGKEGGWTIHFPSGEVLPMYDAAMRYKEEKTPLIVIAGGEYGTGSSRDWAAKGTLLLGVRAVIAQSFERIHRSNLVGVGVLPLEFKTGESFDSLGLKGDEVFYIEGIKEGLVPRKTLKVRAKRKDGSEIKFEVVARLDTPVEVEYYRNGGILQTVLRNLLK
jgi:aconitate hydratase